MPDGEYVAIVRHEVVHDFEYFFLGFAQTDHNARFGAFAVGFGALNLFQAALVFGLRAHLAVQALHGFHVVRYHFLPGGDHAFQCFPIGFGIGNQGFDGGSRRGLFDQTNGLVPYFGTTVGQLITIDGGDYRVFDLHEYDGFGHPAWLIGVVFIGATSFDGTKRTRTGTGIAQNHKGRRTCAPAFAHVRAIPALANGVQLVFVHQSPHFAVIGANRQLYTQPIGLAGPATFITFHADNR